MQMKSVIFAVLAIVVYASCAVHEESGKSRADNTVSADMLLELSPLGEGATETDFSGIDMLALSPEMVEFLEENVKHTYNDTERIRRLLSAMMRSGQFELIYDDSTRTAQETFRAGRGNCLSFTNLFIGMSRQLGLKAYYQEVDIPPDWSATGQAYLISQHVNVNIELKQGFSRVVDFNFYELDDKYKSNVISDQRARAHYFNNIGAEKMLEGESSLAYANFRQSLREDRGFSPAWINMGILHRREGFPDYAEAAYFEALESSPNNLMALSNLANLYEELAMPELARKYEQQVISHRMKNPYFRYDKANEAFLEGDYKTAIENLKYAIRKYDDEDQFYYLLSLSYLMSGDRRNAERWMEKAESVAQETENQQKYRHKLELLRGLDEG